MPPLPHIALRYLLWMVGLNLLNIAAIAAFGLPPSQTVSVMATSVPALLIAQYILRVATRPIVLADWVVVWALMLAHVLVIIAVFAALSPAVRAALADPVGLRQIATVVALVGAMLALFLFIGQLMVRQSR